MSQTQRWLDGYLRAWRSNDAAEVRALFTDDAEYLFRPDDPEPARGIDAILAMWGRDEGSDPKIDLRVLIENDDLGIVKGAVDYGDGQSYSNLWEISFAPDGRARHFVEWYMMPPKSAAG
jgi:ketosteroid isomerase-like protein